jgi:hypothetical protein
MSIGAVSTAVASYQLPRVTPVKAAPERTESSAPGRPDGDGDGDDARAVSASSANKVDIKV